MPADAWGSELASWSPLVTMLAIFGAIVVALLVAGRGSVLERIPNALERLTGIPGWAAAAAGTAMYGLLVAGEGFYSDVAWHIALGRDEVLFTAPHTSIVIGLGMILVASALGVLFATVQRIDTGLRLGRLRVPWSMIPLSALGGAAVAGFPLDELWHEQYGIDVTMWSPTHMLMILGASFSGMASWLVLADAGVSPRDSRWARGAHVLAAWLTLMGLTSSQGEFDFGVPQFQQIFHPILVTLAAAFGLVAIRIVHGAGWAIGIAVGSVVLQTTPILGDSGPVPTRTGGLLVVSAVVVEMAARLLGTDRRLRFALVSGVGVATIGLAAEWVWNQGAHQPWRASLLPDALWLSLLVGLGAATVGVAFARCVARESPSLRVHPGLVVVGGMAVLAALAIPMPRGVGDVTADIHLEAEGDEQARVRVRLDPVDAADDARWFQTISWQGGELVLSEMDEVAPGEYLSEDAMPIGGRGKVLVRLHRGGELMAAPVYFPADREIGEPEIPAVDRVVPFTGEREFLLRETTDGDAWFEWVVYGLLSAVAVGWVAAFVFAAGKVASGSRRQPPVDAASRVLRPFASSTKAAAG
ncbi:MAG: hypothetical protein ACRD0G_10355 [Acidimicrobiales bacterium]